MSRLDQYCLIESRECQDESGNAWRSKCLTTGWESDRRVRSNKRCFVKGCILIEVFD